MAWSDFFMDIGTGSNLNSGDGAGAVSATSLSGNWDGTSVFTPTDGSNFNSGGLNLYAGRWFSIYPSGNTTTPYIAQYVSAVNASNGAVTLSTTAKFGTVPASGTGTRNLIVGGPWADLGMLASGVVLNTGTVTQSTRINVKAGTYANTTTARTFGLAGATTTPLVWRGYKTNPGDQDANNLAVAGTDIPSFTWTTFTATIAGTYQNFHNIDWTSASITAPCVNNQGGFNQFYGCRFTATGTNALSVALQAQTQGAMAFVRCKFTATATATRVVFCSNSINTLFRGCIVTGGIQGIEGSGALILFIMNCVFDTQAGDAIKNTTAIWAINNSIYNPAGHGINLTVMSSSGNVLINNYISNASQSGKFGITNSSGTSSRNSLLIGNTFFNCNGNYNGFAESLYLTDNGSLPYEAFNAALAKDFSFKLPATATGNPASFETTSTYRSYTDVGAVQHRDPQRYRGRRGY